MSCVRPIRTKILSCNLAGDTGKHELGDIRRMMRRVFRQNLIKEGRVRVGEYEERTLEHTRFDNDVKVLVLKARTIFVGRRRCRSTKLQGMVLQGEREPLGMGPAILRYKVSGVGILCEVQ